MWLAGLTFCCKFSGRWNDTNSDIFLAGDRSNFNKGGIVLKFSSKIWSDTSCKIFHTLPDVEWYQNYRQELLFQHSRVVISNLIEEQFSNFNLSVFRLILLIMSQCWCVPNDRFKINGEKLIMVRKLIIVCRKLKSTSSFNLHVIKLKWCSKKECCKQCRHVKFKGTMTKWPVQKQTHRTAQNMQNTKTHQTFRKKTKKLSLIVSLSSLYIFIWLMFSWTNVGPQF